MAATAHRVEHTLTEQYPVIYRMAYALSGRADVGSAVVQAMLGRGLELTAGSRQSPAARWFEHHTVLTTRRALRPQPQPQQDTLVAASPLRTPGFVAFVRAVRALPIQQREAFILHHGGGFDTRRLAVAMDCSMEAAGNHLRGADSAVRQVSQELFEAFVPALAKAYAALLPTEDVYLPPMRRTIRRRLARRRLVRTTGWLIILGLIALASYGAWVLLPILDY